MVETSDLMEPVGPLIAEFFPDTPQQLEDRLQTYLDRAVLKVAAYEGNVENEDDNVRVWALHLAFNAAYLLKANDPASANLQGLSASFAKDQRDAFAREAERYRLEYLALAPEIPKVDEGVSSGSVAVPTVVRW